MCAENDDVLSNDRPYEFEIQAEVLVDYDVAERDDLRPRNFGVYFLNFSRDSRQASPSSAKRCKIAL